MAEPLHSRRWTTLLPGWRALRRVVQLAFMVLILWLFRQTAYHDSNIIQQPVNVFFRLDPLAAASAMLAARTWIETFLPAVAVLLLTLIFGRFFCGWVCPVGTALDYVHVLLRPVLRFTQRWGNRYAAACRPVRYGLLVIVLVAALMAWPMVGYLDPFALWMRFWTFVVDPSWYKSTTAVVMHTDRLPDWLQGHVQRTYGFMSDHHIIPFGPTTYHMARVTLGIVGAIVALELVARRFWCRYLCPLGGMLGLTARWSLLRRLPVRNCAGCRSKTDCTHMCRMGSFDAQGRFLPEACNLCMDCLAKCSDHVARFKVRPVAVAVSTPVGLSRRGLLTSLAAGAAIPLAARIAGAASNNEPPTRLLRPPGAAGENDFLNRCIRCGECMKVCITNGLQPAGLQGGAAGLFSPHLMPRTGYCEYECTLCGQVCPTGAIPDLPQLVKQKTVIGIAAINHDRCLPWAKQEECLVCQEHCPLPTKAIKSRLKIVTLPDGRTKRLDLPTVDHNLCIGCGICENKCPLDGESAILVYRKEAVPKRQHHIQLHQRPHGHGHGHGHGPMS